MSLTTIQDHILQPFVEEALDNLRAMAKMNGHTDPGFIDDPAKFRFKGCAICCETWGHIEGVVLMHHYPETAIAMGNAIRLHVLGEDNSYDQVNEDMAEALTEWSNTVIGRATRNLANQQLGIKFDAPYFIQDTDAMASLLTGVEDIISVPVHVDDVGRFYFNYLIRKVSTQAQFQASAAQSNVTPNKANTNRISTDKKILVVDDMKLVRKSIVKFLGELGYNNVVQADNGKNAIDVYRTEKPDFMFMDVVMPELNGNEVLSEIRKTAQETPIVMLSSVAEQELIDECESLGIAGYIVKPLTIDTGAKILSQYLQ